MKNVHFATYPHEKAKVFSDLMGNYEIPVVVRLGGTMAYEKYPIQINTPKAVMNCIDKLVMKNLLLKHKIPTLAMLEEKKLDEGDFPLVVKGIVRSKGTGVFIVQEGDEMKTFRRILNGRYYLEPLFHTTSEYRLHCTQDDVFFAVKKIKREGHEGEKIINSLNHYNVKDFIKPRLWEQMKDACVKAMKAVGLEIGAIDVGYCSEGKHSFVIHEVNSNPELLHNTFYAYKDRLDIMIKDKIKEFKDK